MIGRVSTQANAAVQAAIETTDIGAKTASASRGLELVRQRGDQQQHHGAGAGQTVQQPDRERLRRACAP